MALQIWLPLNGNLNQQGLADVTVTNNGATVNTSGKIGSCYYFDGSDDYMATTYSTAIGTSDFSISMWLKIPTMTGGSYYAICTSKTTAAASSGFGIYWNYSQKKFLWSTADGSGATEIWMATAVDSIVYDKWIHLVMVRDSNDTKKGCFYINGTRYELSSVPSIRNITTDTKLYIGRCTGGSYNAKMYINDFRIYDHALSPREVKEISKGLVLHYPLNENITAMNNAYSYPTFDTNVAGGGWNHWGGSGHIGTYGQSTDKNYIFRPNQTYCHWVANGAGATYNYLLYQSPDYGGGYRSVQCICKEENGIEITNDVVYATWNNRSGGVPNNSWTSITPLGNGFYWCKAEGVMQDGNNDLIGFYVKPGYKVYFSEAYLENGKEICSDPFLTDRTTIYDTSGFGYNGELYKVDDTASISTIQNSPRYSYATNVHSANSTVSQKAGTAYIRGNVALTTPDQLTIAFWCYARPEGYGGATTVQGQFCTTNNTGDNTGSDYQTSAMNHRDSGVDINNSSANTHLRLLITFLQNTWCHYVFSYDGQNAKSYRNGVLQNTVSFSSATALASFTSVILGFSKAGGAWRRNNNDYSDFRIYATALSPDDVLELYHTSASLADNGTLMAY